MSESAVETAAATGTEGAEGGSEKATPPWERDGTPFDPERAWNLISTLRGEKESLKNERDTLNTEVTTFRTAAMTDQERLEAEREGLRGENGKLASENARLKVALKYKIAEEDFDLLGSGTEEEIAARAERIAAMRSAQEKPPVARSFDGGTRTPAAGDDMNQIIRRQLGG